MPLYDQDPLLFASVHQGPYLTVESLAESLKPDQAVFLVAGVSQTERERQGLPYISNALALKTWGSVTSMLRQLGIRAVVRSCSEQVAEPNVERMVSTAAKEAGVPVFVIEDFPGNYWPTPEERLDGLFVEHSTLIETYLARGVERDHIYVAPNPRYARLEEIDAAALRLKSRGSLGLGSEPVVLWAGQPDGRNSVLALERILTRFRDARPVLLFRAHSRDPYYQTGEYQQLLANTPMRVLDVSNHVDALELYCAADLVVTQFSSAGVEASYLGVPAVFALFEDLGKEYLRTFKSYDTLPWTRDECSYLIQREEDTKEIMEQALFDETSRINVLRNFRRNFGMPRTAAQSIIRQIQKIASKSQPLTPRMNT